MERVTIAPVDRADAAELIEANLASRAYHAPWAEPFIDLDGFDRWFAPVEAGGKAAFAAREARSGEVVGVVALSEIVRGALQGAYLGYFGMAPSAGRGLMTEAVRLVLLHAFTELGLHRVEANIQPGNEASLRLVRRLGFRREGFSPEYLHLGGEWRDHERWALLARELM